MAEEAPSLSEIFGDDDLPDWLTAALAQPAPAIASSASTSSSTPSSSPHGGAPPSAVPPAAGPARRRNKTGRSQYSSCDACRLRKVRCIRDSPSSASCRGCTSKNISCTTAFVDAHAGGVGKRLELARQQFGTDTSSHAGGGRSGGTILHHDQGSGSRTSGGKTDAAPGLVPAALRGPQENLNRLALSSGALSSFLDAFHRDIHFAVPSTDFDRLRQCCVDAHFDIRNLDVEDQALAISISACTLRANRQPPPDPQQSNSPPGLPLAVPDPRGTCNDLVESAVRLGDQAAVLRQPSARGLEIMRLLLMLTSGGVLFPNSARTAGAMFVRIALKNPAETEILLGDCAKDRRRSARYRSYEAAYVQHLRLMAQDEKSIDSTKAKVHFYTHIVSSCFDAAVTGYPPIYMEEDLEFFAEMAETSTQQIIANIMRCDSSNPDTGFDLIMGPLCLLARSIYHRLTSAKARKRKQIDLEFIRECLPELERIETLQTIYEQKLSQIFPDGWPLLLSRFSVLFRVLRGTLLLICMDELEAGMRKEISAFASIPRICELQEVYDKMLRRFIVFVSQHRFPVASGPLVGRTYSLVDGLLSFVTVGRVQWILKIPCLEDNPPEGSAGQMWNRSIKASCAEFYLRVCTYVQDCVPGMDEEVAKLKPQVDSLVEQAGLLSPALPDLWPGLSPDLRLQPAPEVGMSGSVHSTPGSEHPHTFDPPLGTQQGYLQQNYMHVQDDCSFDAGFTG